MICRLFQTKKLLPRGNRFQCKNIDISNCIKLFHSAGGGIQMCNCNVGLRFLRSTPQKCHTPEIQIEKFKFLGTNSNEATISI